MKNSRTPAAGSDDSAQHAIDAMQDVDFSALSFAQLKRLAAVLADANRRIAREAAQRAVSDAQGDTVRVAVPPSLDR